MTRRTTDAAGYVLLELTVAAALLSLAVASVADFGHRAMQEREWALGYSTDLAELRRTLDTVETDIRHATHVHVRHDRVELSTIDGMVTLVHRGSELVRRPERGPESVLASCITDLEASSDGRTVRLRLTMRRRSASPRSGPTVSTSVALRNERAR